MAETDIETSGGAPDDLAPNALVGEIESTRADLARTIGEVAHRVAPRSVARRTLDKAKERLSQVDPRIGGAVALAAVSVTCYVIWRKLRKLAALVSRRSWSARRTRWGRAARSRSPGRLRPGRGTSSRAR